MIFQCRILDQNRVQIPKITVDALELEKGDIIELEFKRILKKSENE